MLDGGELRSGISADLGFSRADRETHVMRVAALADDIVRRGDIAICALVSPYQDTRLAARTLIGPDRFLEVYVATPLSECERRDTEGLYRRARRKEIAGLTGLDAPYEPPTDPELVITTVGCSVGDNVSRILAELASRGNVRSSRNAGTEGLHVPDLTVEQFAARLHDRFTVVHETSRFEFALVEARASRGGRPDGRQPFALLFHGPLTPILPQAIYRFEHPAFPPLDIFIVPVGPEGDRMRYEAIFS